MEINKLGCLISPFAALWRWLDARVKGAHENWMQVLGWTVTALITFAAAWYFLPERPSPPTRAGSEAAASAEGRDLLASDFDKQAYEGPPVVEGAKSETSANSTGACDVEYALSKKGEFRELIEAEVRQCVRFVDNPIELYYACRVEDGIYAVSLKYQFSGTINDERLPFAAEYRGPREIDKTEVKVRPLTPDFQRLCREKAQASRR